MSGWRQRMEEGDTARRHQRETWNLLFIARSCVAGAWQLFWSMSQEPWTNQWLQPLMIVILRSRSRHTYLLRIGLTLIPWLFIAAFLTQQQPKTDIISGDLVSGFLGVFEFLKTWELENIKKAIWLGFSVFRFQRFLKDVGSGLEKMTSGTFEITIVQVPDPIHIDPVNPYHLLSGTILIPTGCTSVATGR